MNTKLTCISDSFAMLFFMECFLLPKARQWSRPTADSEASNSCIWIRKAMQITGNIFILMKT